MLIFIIVAGLVIRCSINVDPLLTYCVAGSFKEFGLLASAGVLELVYEFKGIASIFQRKKD